VLAVFSAAWLVPVSSPPVPDGWVAIESGRIVALGRRGSARERELAARADRAVDLGRVAIMPALVNAHTHLELSWMRGRVAPSPTMPDWVRALLHLRRSTGDAPSAIAPAIAELRAAGTAVVGDVSNTLASVEPLCKAELDAVVFHEVLGFNVGDAAAVADQARSRAQAAATRPGIRVGLAAHAPYSTSPALFTAVRREAEAGRLPLGVHLGESPEEVEFLRSGSGPWRDLLRDLGSWDPAWTAPNCGPAEYLDRLGFLAPGVVVVHGTQLTDAELALLARRRAALVTCPRSNAWTGVGIAPWAAIQASGVTVAIGTDSLASAPDLNIFAEMAAIQRVVPGMPADWIVRAATLGGAMALGCDDAYGSLEPGKRAALIAVDLRRAHDEVERVLTSGIAPDRITWVEAAAPAQAC
jgi:cytosine/adenosine deaminase-related metal-dependent hydrolase